MQEIDISSPLVFLLTTLFFFSGIFGRYVATALLFNFFVRKAFRTRLANRLVHTRPRRNRQDWVEIGWSFVTSVLFALAGTLLMLAWQQGYTQIYTEWDAFPKAWLVVSVLLVLFLHETYYYWLHRWMHRPGVYKYLHKVHHDSITTSAWTSFSFHPLESILQAIILPILTFVIPLHVAAIGMILTLMTITSAINHLNTELYPRDFHRHWFGRWWIGATHHSLHHAQFRYNFGLYFTFWDKWMKTESPDYERLFIEKTGGNKHGILKNDVTLAKKVEVKVH